MLNMTPFPELYFPLQCWYMGDRPGTVEAPAGPQGLHSSHGTLHRQDHGPGQKLRPSDHRQENLHKVSTAWYLTLSLNDCVKHFNSSGRIR